MVSPSSLMNVVNSMRFGTVYFTSTSEPSRAICFWVMVSSLARELTITQKQIARLGSDVEVKYTVPKRIEFTTFIKDDGDTIYPPMPKTGAFNAPIGKETKDL